MNSAKEMAYLVTRERQSRELSATPGDLAVQRVHLNMADAYAAQIAALARLVC